MKVKFLEDDPSTPTSKRYWINDDTYVRFKGNYAVWHRGKEMVYREGPGRWVWYSTAACRVEVNMAADLERAFEKYMADIALSDDHV